MTRMGDPTQRCFHDSDGPRDGAFAIHRGRDGTVITAIVRTASLEDLHTSPCSSPAYCWCLVVDTY